jgi:hypothetical protein
MGRTHPAWAPRSDALRAFRPKYRQPKADRSPADPAHISRRECSNMITMMISRGRSYGWDVELHRLYADLRPKCPDLIRLSDESLAALGAILRDAETRRNAARYVHACAGAIVWIVTWTFLFGVALTFLNESYPWLKTAATRIDVAHTHPHIALTVGALILAVLVYTLLIPFGRASVLRFEAKALGILNAPTKGSPVSRRITWMYDFARDNKTFVRFAVIANYTILPFIALSLLYGPKQLELLSKTVLGIWLFIFSGVLAFSVAFIIMLILHKRLLASTGSTALQRCGLNILRLLDELVKLPDTGLLTGVLREHLVSSIRSIANQLRDVHSNGTDDPLSRWVAQQMSLAGQNFQSLAIWLYFPQRGTREELIARLCQYSNCIFTGRLHELPRSEVVETSWSKAMISSPWRQGLYHLGVAVYLLTPVMAFVLVIAWSKLAISSMLQTGLGLLYLAWVVSGVLYFSGTMSSDARTFLVDIVKVVAGRKS